MVFFYCWLLFTIFHDSSFFVPPSKDSPAGLPTISETLSTFSSTENLSSSMCALKEVKRWYSCGQVCGIRKWFRVEGWWISCILCRTVFKGNIFPRGFGAWKTPASSIFLLDLLEGGNLANYAQLKVPNKPIFDVIVFCLIRQSHIILIEITDVYLQIFVLWIIRSCNKIKKQ